METGGEHAYLELVSRYETLTGAERAVRFCAAKLAGKTYRNADNPEFAEKYLRAQIAVSRRYLDSLNYTRADLENLLEMYYKKFGWDNEKCTPFVQQDLGRSVAALAAYNDFKQDGCQFCHPGLNRYGITEQLLVRNRPVFETSLFRGYSDISPVDDGHILVAYKGHHLSSSQTNWHGIDQLRKVADVVRDYNADEHGKITEGFEHGTGACGLGTCIDHTHMHLVTPKHSAAGLIRSKVDLQPFAWETMGDIPKTNFGYFMLMDEHGNLSYNSKDLMPSQFGRVIYGGVEGSGETNWRTNVNAAPNDCIDKINRVKAHYAGLEDYTKKRHIRGFVFDENCKKTLLVEKAR